MPRKQPLKATTITPITEGMTPEQMLEAMKEMQARMQELENQSEAAPQGNTTVVIQQPDKNILPTNAASEEQAAYLNERVPFRAIKDNGKYKDDITVAVNGEITVIQRGHTVMIPRHVYLALEQSDRQDTITASLIDDLQKDFEGRKSQL